MAVTFAPHQFATVVPSMSADEYRGLVESIRVSGLRVPIVLFEDQILDGVNRWRACEETNQPPTTRVFNPTKEGDPLRFVIDVNVARRHLTESQRALVAARIATLPKGRPKNGSHEPFTVQTDAAEQLGVGRESVKRARVVLEDGAVDLVKAVDEGKLTVTEAKDLVDLPSSEQSRIALEPDKRKRRQRVREGRKRARVRRKAKAAKVAAVELVLTAPAAKPDDQRYSVEAWKKLTNKDRQRIIEEGFEGKPSLNKQTGESIEWARWSHNVVTGCLHDCPYCYARDIAEKSPAYPQKFEPTFLPYRLAGPAMMKVPEDADGDLSYRNIFANSMADLFGQWVPTDWIEAAIEMAIRHPQWNFLTLTKFPSRAVNFTFPKNWWMGTTVDAQSRVAAAEKAFAKIQCGTKWLSVEPLLERLTFTRLDLFHWIVIGGASASTRTPDWVPPLDWIAPLHDAARAAGLRIYYKTNTELPESLRCREFPWGKVSPVVLPKAFRYLKGL